jgi:hypothetical protein
MLTLRLLPTPDFSRLTPVQKFQFQYIPTHVGNHEESLPLMEFFEVLDENGKHLYDMHLMCGDDGQVFAANTKKRVGGFSQGGADTGDPVFEEELDTALTRFKESARKRKRAPAEKKAAVKKKKTKR